MAAALDLEHLAAASLAGGPAALRRRASSAAADPARRIRADARRGLLDRRARGIYGQVVIDGYLQHVTGLSRREPRRKLASTRDLRACGRHVLVIVAIPAGWPRASPRRSRLEEKSTEPHKCPRCGHPQLLKQLRSQAVSALGDRPTHGAGGRRAGARERSLLDDRRATRRTQLRRWERCARRIRDPPCKRSRLAKLREERFNAQVAATLATLAPRAHRKHAVRSDRRARGPIRLPRRPDRAAVTDPLRDGRQLSQRSPTPSPRPMNAAGTTTATTHNPTTTATSKPGRDRQERACSTACSGRDRRGGAARAPCAVPRHRSAPTPSPARGPPSLKSGPHAKPRTLRLSGASIFAGAASSVLGLHALIAAAADPRTTPEDRPQQSTRSTSRSPC